MSQGNHGEESKPKFCQTCGAQLFQDSNFCHQCGMQILPKILDDSAATAEYMDSDSNKLYQVHSIVNNFHYKGIFYDNLKINWFVTDRDKPPVPFEDSIKNYIELSTVSRAQPENFLKGLFTREEAELIKQYLTAVQKIETNVESCPLPVPDNKSGHHDFPTPPGTDFIRLHKKSSYNLPFKVEGIFNIKMADEQVRSDENITVASEVNPAED